MTQERAVKAYYNTKFLRSREARTMRILCEYLEPEKRFHDMKVYHTVVFFGSARIKKDEEHISEVGKYYNIAEEFAFKLASWSREIKQKEKKFYICTGGGEGIMSAANQGASRAGERSIGLNISLPFEQQPNRYISPEFNFEFHYFFMRKLWFMYQAKAMVFFPGGFGTLDELFEALTLVQTRKMVKEDLPILLCGKSFWKELIDFQKLVDLKLIAPEDLNLFHFFDNAEEGFNYLKPRLENIIMNVNISVIHET